MGAPPRSKRQTKPTEPVQAEFDFTATPERLVAVEAEIADLEARLGVLKRLRRAIKGGLATAKQPRKRLHSDEKIWTTFDDAERKAEGRTYGLVTEVAATLRIATRTVHRALKRR